MSIDELIKHLEQAKGPSRELDAHIWAELDNRDVYVGPSVFAPRSLLARSRVPPRDVCVTGGWEGEGFYVAEQRPPLPEYTASLDAARKLSDWVLCYASDIGADGLALVKLGDPTTSPSVEVTGIHSRLEIAWCIAALRARAQS